MGKFYKIKLNDKSRDDSRDLFGIGIRKDVSTYVETERDLIAEANKKGLKSVDVTVVEQIPERGEDGNAPRFHDFGDEGLGEAAQKSAEAEESEE